MKFSVEPWSSKTITRDEIENIYKEYVNNNFEFNVDNFYKKYKLSNEEVSQLENYMWGMYWGTNEGLRWGVNVEWAEVISDAIKKLPKYEWDVYRWIGTSENTYKMFNNLKEWETFSDQAFLSTSTSKSVANNFMNDPTFWNNKVMMYIKSKNWAFAWNAWESEVLFDRGTQFKVIKKNNNWKVLEIYLEEI